MIDFKTGTMNRIMDDVRDNYMIGMAFILIKVLVKKLFFKPYRIVTLMEKRKRECSKIFRNNLVIMGYTLVALVTDSLFELYKDKL